MTKRIIVIERCDDCPNGFRGALADNLINFGCNKVEQVCPQNGIPDWCPLPQMPERFLDKNEPERIDKYRSEAREQGLEPYMGSFGYGWNKCLEAIENGKV